MLQCTSYRLPVAMALAFILAGVTPGSLQPRVALLAAASSEADRPMAVVAATSSAAAGVATLARIPLHFEAAADGSRFTARGRGYDVTVQDGRAEIALRDDAGTASVGLTPIGTGTAAALTGTDRLPGVVNRYVGPAASWETGRATYGAVRASAVAPGIDLV